MLSFLEKMRREHHHGKNDNNNNKNDKNNNHKKTLSMPCAVATSRKHDDNDEYSMSSSTQDMDDTSVSLVSSVVVSCLPPTAPVAPAALTKKDKTRPPTRVHFDLLTRREYESTYSLVTRDCAELWYTKAQCHTFTRACAAFTRTSSKRVRQRQEQQQQQQHNPNQHNIKQQLNRYEQIMECLYKTCSSSSEGNCQATTNRRDNNKNKCLITPVNVTTCIDIDRIRRLIPLEDRIQYVGMMDHWTHRWHENDKMKRQALLLHIATSTHDHERVREQCEQITRPSKAFARILAESQL